MTLDEAIDQFAANKHAETAMALLDVTRQYWEDAMIGDNEFADYLRKLADWLQEE